MTIEQWLEAIRDGYRGPYVPELQRHLPLDEQASDSAGYHQFVDDTGAAFGSFEVFWQRAEFYNTLKVPEDYTPAGWYWAAGYPGCLYDGDPQGPFATSKLAFSNAKEQ